MWFLDQTNSLLLLFCSFFMLLATLFINLLFLQVQTEHKMLGIGIASWLEGLIWLT